MLAILSLSSTLGSNTLLLLHRLAVRNFHLETLLLSPGSAVLCWNSQTLPLLDSSAGLGVKVPGEGRALRHRDLNTVLLRLCQGAVLTGDRLTDGPGDGVTLLSGHTPALLPHHQLRDDQALLGRDRLAGLGGLEMVMTLSKV